MEKFAYYKINEYTNPRSASDAFKTIKKSGFDSALIFHEKNADLKSAAYKEKLMALFRGAYRHKLKLFIADDNGEFSGTAFGEMASVYDLRRKEILETDTPMETDVILSEKGEEYTVARCMTDGFPDLTNPLATELITDSVYSPLLREYSKFAGYEFAGFVCKKPIVFFTDKVLYSTAAVEKFEEKYSRKPDFTALCKKGEEYEKYCALIEKCVEENYVLPIKEYCDSKKMKFIVSGGENSVNDAFAKNKSYIPIGSGKYSIAENTKDAICTLCNGAVPIVGASDGMKKVSELMDFFEGECEKLPRYDVDNLKESKEGCIIVNMTDEVKERGFLFEDDYMVLDWEKGEYYSLDKKTTYTFYPYGFMCIFKKNDDYLPSLPLRVGSVLCGEYEPYKSVDFEVRENKYAFYLPDESLAGKGIELVGDCEYMKLKLGTMEQCFITKPYIVPLFDFLQDAGCVAEVLGGEITNIKILKKRKQDTE